VAILVSGCFLLGGELPSITASPGSKPSANENLVAKKKGGKKGKKKDRKDGKDKKRTNKSKRK
jgi:hypothetical protein